MKRLFSLLIYLLMALVAMLLFFYSPVEAREPGGLDALVPSGTFNSDGARDQAVIVGTLAPGDWWDDDWRFRLPIEVNSNGYERYAKPAEAGLDFTQLLATLGISEAFDKNSIRVVEVSDQGLVVDESVDFQFDQDENYDASTNAKGTLVFLLHGTTVANLSRYFHIYFDTTSNGPFAPLTVSSQVTVTDDISHEGQMSFRIQTQNATYYYHKQGAGFASMEDPGGTDWIGYHPGGRSAGEFRGIPNLGVFAHPGYANSVSSLVSQGPIKATLSSETTDGKWALLWEIYPTYARMTLLRRDTNYWFLYEGTPNGQLDINEDYVVRSTGVKTYVSQSWVGDIPEPEWAYFGDDKVGRVLFVAHHEDDDALDQFWQMEGEMTVFGFGRQYPCCERYLTLVPAHFTIGFAENSSSASQVIGSAFRDLAVTLGQPEAVNHPPVLDPIGQKTVVAGDTLSFTVSASDPDNTTPTLSIQDLPDSATFNDHGNGTANFTWVPTSTDEGIHIITFVASDGVLTDTETVTITVNSVNCPPVLGAIGEKSVVIGDILSFTVSASDPDNTTPTLSTQDLPGSATFDDHGNGTANFTWVPTSTDEGIHTTTFVASDGVLTDSETITITVSASAPQFDHQVFLPFITRDQQVRSTMYTSSPLLTCHSSSTSVPSTYTRTPLSTSAWKRYSPSSNGRLRVQRAEKPSAGRPAAGAFHPQLKSTAASLRTSVGAPARSRLL